MSYEKLFVVEVLDETTGLFEIEESFPDEENAEAFRSDLEDTEGAITRLTVYNREPVTKAVGIVRDYTQSVQPVDRMKPESTPAEKVEAVGSWRSMSQNPYAYVETN